MLLRAMLFFWLNNSLLLYAALHASLPQDWAVAGDLNHLGLEWHVPSVEELQMTERLLEEFSAARAGQTAGLHAGRGHGQVRGEIGSGVHCISCILLVYIYITSEAAVY